jgi:hypothetical protein
MKWKERWITQKAGKSHSILKGPPSAPLISMYLFSLTCIKYVITFNDFYFENCLVFIYVLVFHRIVIWTYYGCFDNLRKYSCEVIFPVTDCWYLTSNGRKFTSHKVLLKPKQNCINQLHATQINHHAITMYEKYIIKE